MTLIDPQWQSRFGQSEIKSVTVADTSTWTPQLLDRGIYEGVVMNEAVNGIKVSFDNGTNFVTMLRAIKTGAEFDFQDRLPFVTRGEPMTLYFQTVAGTNQIVKLLLAKEA